MKENDLIKEQMKYVEKKTALKSHSNFEFYILHITSTPRGITLIALIITIIVMIILVGVTVNITINGGLFNMAEKATKQTQISEIQELVLSEIIAKQLNNDGDISTEQLREILIKYFEDVPNPLLPSDIKNLKLKTKKEYGGYTDVSLFDIYNGNVRYEMLSYNDTPKNEKDVLKEKAKYIDGDNIAIIPKGFKIINDTKGRQSIDEGLVIQDSDENEFVWIPVNYIPTGSIDENGLDSGFLDVFCISSWSDNKRKSKIPSDYKYYQEPFRDGYDNEIKDYYEMMKSVQKYKGFYVGRYEAGSVENREKKSNGTTTMVVKRDQYPYNYIGWGLNMKDYTSDVIDLDGLNQGKGALYLCKHFYDEKDVGVISTLCYGIQWNSILDFVKDENHNVTNSLSWGNYRQISFTINRDTAKETTVNDKWVNIQQNDEFKKEAGEVALLTTGASDIFASKNIYDLAGNCSEVVTGAVPDAARRGCTGGHAYATGDSYASAALLGNCEVNTGNSFYSFRPTLYIK